MPESLSERISLPKCNLQSSPALGVGLRSLCGINMPRETVNSEYTIVPGATTVAADHCIAQCSLLINAKGTRDPSTIATTGIDVRKAGGAREYRHVKIKGLCNKILRLHYECQVYKMKL